MITTPLNIPSIRCGTCGAFVSPQEQDRIESIIETFDLDTYERVADAMLAALPAGEQFTIPCKICLEHLLGREPAQTHLL